MVHGMILQMGMIGRQVEMVMGNHDRVISRPQTDYRYHRDSIGLSVACHSIRDSMLTEVSVSRQHSSYDLLMVIIALRGCVPII